MVDMRTWQAALRAPGRKKALPILSFPSAAELGLTVEQLIKSAENQAAGMKLVADRTDAAAAVSMMDLSVEAEAFGASVRFFETEVPSVIGTRVNTPEDAEALVVPEVGTARTGIFVDAIRLAAQRITDRPVLAGIIGPFSLAGRLMDVTKTMLLVMDEPEMVHTCLRKATDFLIAYAKAFKAAGAQGIMMAEPLAGLISPRMATKFSAPYVKEIVDAVQTPDFPVFYHNCGNNTIRQISSILSTGAAGFHFGNAISMPEMLAAAPADCLIMGNVDPANVLSSGTPETVRQTTLDLMRACCPGHPNFLISSGCDIPPHAPWANLLAFFAAVDEYYSTEGANLG